MDIKTVAAYVRVSTQEQAQEGYSIGEQTERLTKYCEAKGWVLKKVYTDGGYSGAKLDRPAIQQLIADCNQYDMILVYKLDRLSRSQKDTLYLIEDVFKKNGVDFTSLQENFDTSTPFGMAMIGILSVFAQLEREQIKDRLIMGKAGRVKEGYWTGSIAPIGYTYTSGSGNQKGVLIPNDEADQIRTIFKQYISGKSQRQIWLYMNDHYPNTHYNNPNTVKQILNNPVYCGRMVWKGDTVDGIHTPLITAEEYEQAQSIKQRMKGRNSGKQTHLLTGLCYCGVCGSRMDHSTSRSPYKDKVYIHQYYACAVQNKRINATSMIGMKCDNKRIRAEVLEEAVLNELKKLKLSKVKESKPVDNSKQIAAIEKQIEKAIQLYTVDGIDYEQIKAVVFDLNKKKERLANEAAPKASNNAARTVLLSLPDILSSDDMEAKIAAVNAIIQRVTVTHGQIEIQFNFE